MEKKGYLLLANGQLFEGVLQGAQQAATGEMVFTTATSGYMELLTDASYEGQIVVQTFPTIGNPGVIAPQPAAKHLAGYVVRELCEKPSNFRCEGTLDEYLAAQGIPCLTGVDTRALTRTIRNNGEMNAAILLEKPEDIEAAAAALRAAKPFVPALTDGEVVYPTTEGKYSVVLWDMGSSEGLKLQLEARNCSVTCVPATTRAEDIIKLAPDGVVLGNGAGNPADYQLVIGQIAEVCKRRIPVFGVGLGHQLLALSQGATTFRLSHGHRGGNQPAKDVKKGLTFMTAQSHSYCVDKETLPSTAAVRYENANDGTCEGIDYLDMPAFSVQFHPEAEGGPLDTRFLFDRFIAMMNGRK